MKVRGSVTVVEMEGDYGPVEGVVACCSRCDHETESYGTSAASVRRCLVLLREECPLNESNFYEADEADD